MFGYALAESLPIDAFLHFVKEQIAAMVTRVRILPPVFCDDIVEHGVLHRLQTIISEVEIENIITRDAVLQQIMNFLEKIERFAATSDASDDVHSIEHCRLRQLAYDFDAA